jgi:tetratricopeptide (TPR) repeat protein
VARFTATHPLVPLLLAWVVLATGCVRMTTLSKPRSEEFMVSMAEASRHAHHGRLEEAVAAYERAAEQADRRVDRDEAQYRQARALVKLERTDEALGLLDAIADRAPPSRRTGRAMFDAAKLRQDRGEREPAMRGMRRVVLEHSRSGAAARALWFLVKDRRDEGDDQGALELVRELYPRLRSTPLGDDLLDYEARILLDHGDRLAARAAWERLVAEHPYPEGHRWDDALHRLADMAEEDGDYPRAIEYLQALLQRHESTAMVGSYTLPSMPRAQLRIARIRRHRMGDPEGAAAAYRRLVREFPRSTLRDDALVELGEMWLEGGKRSAACELFERVTREFEVGSARRRAARHLQTECGGGG